MGAYDAGRHFFTVDVEDYFQVGSLEPFVARASWESLPSRIERNVDVLLQILSTARAAATFFASDWVAEKHPRVIRSIVLNGHEVAVRGSARVDRVTPERFREAVRASKRTLEDTSGAQVVGFRAPGFSLLPGCEWAFDVLLEESYEYDSSRLPGDRPGVGCPNAPRYPHAVRCESAGGSLMEIPFTPLHVPGSRISAAGGALLRHMPYSVVRGAFHTAERAGVPGMLYLHPWEVDPEQPRMRLPLATRVRHYGGLARTAPRLTRLLRDFRFGSIAPSLFELSQSAPTVFA